MYKKIFMGIAAVAALTLVSCSSDDLNSLSDNSSKNEAISFDGYLGRSAVSVNGSRGSELTKEKLKTDGFGVFGNYSTTAGQNFGSNLFNNEKVTSSSSTEPVIWKYDNTKYWPTQGHIDFLAYAPHDSEQKLKNNKDLDFTVNSDVTKQIDLLWDHAENKIKPSNSEKVNFTFKHALAKIGYSVKSKADYSPTTIKVNSIKLVGDLADENTKAFYTKGTIDLSKDNNDANDLWTTNPADTKQNFTLLSSAQTLNTEYKPDNYLFVIPQDFSGTANDLYVVVEYTVKTADNIEITNTVSQEISKKFLQGKAYMINLIIGLTPIEFEAKVDSWTNGEDIGGIELN